MADTNGANASGSQEGAETNLHYKAPAVKSVQEILSTDNDDESLRLYKQKLLGDEANAIVDAANPKNVIVRSLTLVVVGRDDVTIDLAGDVNKLAAATFVIKEGCQYRLRVNFHVQREIVAGLKYVQKVTRMGVPGASTPMSPTMLAPAVDKDEFMVGSYGPKTDLQSYTTPVDEAPSGMMHRGTYKVRSTFTDDDRHEWLTWAWTLDIGKDWH